MITRIAPVLAIAEVMLLAVSGGAAHAQTPGATTAIPSATEAPPPTPGPPSPTPNAAAPGGVLSGFVFIDSNASGARDGADLPGSARVEVQRLRPDRVVGILSATVGRHIVSGHDASRYDPLTGDVTPQGRGSWLCAATC